ncbi:MAG: peptidoglycan editing factor PgeF [Clostridia bacterium]|nr:peptidoglycan editing factor PgeF [Clostridia bacterium]
MIISKTLNRHENDGVVYYTFPKLESAGGNLHAFSTRLGGISTGDCASMSFGFSLGDNRDNVLENYRRFCAAFCVKAENAVLSQQTHTANLRIVTKDDVGKGIFRERDYTDIDGLVTNETDIVLVTQYADCTPLVFFDPVTKTVATSHAGWRGTVAEIGKKTVELMSKEFGAKPENILVGIGPNIGVCCYEVDDPVINEINKLLYLDFNSCYTSKGNGKYMLDLRETNRQILLNSGIKTENIDVADLCTCCNSDIFHSHRATGGKRGTLAAMISLK